MYGESDQWIDSLVTMKLSFLPLIFPSCLSIHPFSIIYSLMSQKCFEHLLYSTPVLEINPAKIPKPLDTLLAAFRQWGAGQNTSSGT